MNIQGWKIAGFLFFVAIFFLACQQPGKQENPLPVWSSNDPLAIPYRIRLQKFEKGNLVRNSSFELGKILPVDTVQKSFSIDGWQKTGVNVQWIDLENDSTVSGNEVFSGKHAIKINRILSDEIADKGEGIMSGFIRVIPGNYSFSFYTRLLDIRPYSARLGTRMYDAIEIRLLFYDKNKNLLDSRYLLPFKGQKIDNSFKSLSFANYEHIKEFEWGRIIGKSHNFPFKEGDIPDATRHIKIFIGLKGTGTMWIDDVDLHFTASNFTPLERLSSIIDSSYAKQDLIIPTPKQVKKLESVLVFKPGEGKETLPKIIVPASCGNETHLAATLILEKVQQILKKAGADENYISAIQLQSTVTSGELRDSRLVLSIGKNILYEKYYGILPVKSIMDREQGYFVYTSNDFPNVLFLAGNNPPGDYYAAATVTQLFDNQFPVLYKARIIDYPDIQQRFYYIHAWQQQNEINGNFNTIHKLLPYKLNGAYIGVNLNSPVQYYLNTLESFSKPFSQSELFHLIQFIGPDYTDNFSINIRETGDTIKTITYLKDAEKIIQKLIVTGHRSHSLGIAIAPSFLSPHDTTMEYNLTEILALTDNFKAEKKLMMNLQKFIASVCKEQKLEYCIPWYNNELVDFSLGYADVLLASMMEDMDVNTSFLWSGSSFYTQYTDAADIYRFSNLLGNPPVLLDNSLLTNSKVTGYDGLVPYYPGKLRLYNVFEPFCNSDLFYYKDILNTNRVFINQVVNSELEEIKMLSALDFYWNMEAYDPDLSLWKILVSRYGYALAKELVDFGDACSNVMEINLRIQKKNQLNKNYRNGVSAFPLLQEHLDNITAGLGKDHKLVIELTAIAMDCKLTFEKSYKHSAQ
jgi:hypothetical protein